MLEDSGSLTGEVCSHLSRHNSSTDTILVHDRRATHEAFINSQQVREQKSSSQHVTSHGSALEELLHTCKANHDL